MKYKKGITLVHILLTIAIIGILASAITIPLNNHFKKTRDSVRKNDLANIGLALTQYYYDNNRAEYPTSGNWIGDIVPEYLKTLPTDPKQTNPPPDYFYIEELGQQKVTLWATLEREDDKEISSMPDAQCNETPPAINNYNYCKTSTTNFR